MEPRTSAAPPASAAGREPAEGTAPRLVVDLLLGLAVASAVALLIADQQPSGRPPDAVAYLFAAGFGSLMLLRRFLPRTVLMLTAFGLFAYYTMDYPVIGIAVPVVAALFSAADLGLTPWSVGTGTFVLAVSTYFRHRDGALGANLFGYEVLAEAGLIAAAIALGDGLRTRRLRAAQHREVTRLTGLQLAREAELRVQSEREHLSRDLHDVMGHAMSVISLHANVAREALGRDDTAVGEALEHIRATNARASRDLRSMLRILRSAGGYEDTRGALSLAGISDLAETARAAGIEVASRIEVDPAELASPVDTVAYRVVQESITNVIRHAGAGRVQVNAEIRDGTLHLGVIDDGCGPSAEETRSGHGLSGLAERVRLLGGSLNTRSPEEGGFVVEARLPAKLDP